jgi:hypothetical protein
MSLPRIVSSCPESLKWTRVGLPRVVRVIPGRSSSSAQASPQLLVSFPCCCSPQLRMEKLTLEFRGDSARCYGVYPCLRLVFVWLGRFIGCIACLACKVLAAAFDPTFCAEMLAASASSSGSDDGCAEWVATTLTRLQRTLQFARSRALQVRVVLSHGCF